MRPKLDEEGANTGCHDLKNLFVAAVKLLVFRFLRAFGDEQYLFSAAVLTCDAGFEGEQTEHTEEDPEDS